MFVAGAKLFSTIFPISYTQGLLVGSLIIISYTFLGGFLAVCTTDTVQGMLMFFALVFVPLAAISYVGGFGQTFSQIDPATWQLFPNGDGSVTALLIASSLAWGLGYFGQPHILVRFMAVAKPKDIKPATIVAMVWVIITLTAAVLIGPLGHLYLAEPLADGQHETIFMVLINQMFNPILTGVFLSAILAAIMSTAASQLLVASSALSNDIYQGLFRKHASEKRNHVSQPWSRIADCRHCAGDGNGPEQLYFRHCKLRLGWLRRILRSCRVYVAVLETDDP